MIHWKDEVDMSAFFGFETGFFENALSTATFQQPPSRAAGGTTIDPSLPEHMQRDIENSLVFYNELRTKKVTVTC